MTSRVGIGRRRVWVLILLGLAFSRASGQARAADQVRLATQTTKPSTSRSSGGGGAVPVTPVEGPSTLHHLGLTIEHSSMGWEGQWGGPSPNVAPRPSGGPSPLDDQSVKFMLSGSDLYRVSCRACHKADGAGGPPEINSIIGPVQAASVPWMTQRMKEMGRSVAPSFIRELTSGTEADLRKRLKAGGHNMPSFAHLSDEEIRVLRPYLDELAGVPGARPQKREITEPAVRVGELIVKGTCHICHDATGDDTRTTTVLNNIIPSLATLRRQKTQGQFVLKVHEGAQVPLSAGGVMSRGRMPVFNYLTANEVAAAYAYLIAYPPK